MYEDLLDALRFSRELNSYLNIDKKVIEQKYGDDIYKIITMLQDDMYKINATEIEGDLNSLKTKAKENFLKLHPDTCLEVIDILLSDYLFSNR